MLNSIAPFSAAALMALMFAVPLILYMKEFDPKPPTQDTCNNFSLLVVFQELSMHASIVHVTDTF